jgi:hypothetical protein
LTRTLSKPSPFAILGYHMLRGMTGNIPTVTGARSPAILGKLTLPPTPFYTMSNTNS